MAKPPRKRSKPDLDERRRRAVAQIELGDLLKSRREGDVNKSQQEIADSVGCTQGFYAELEGGTRSSGDVRLWLRIADALDLAPKHVLRLAWEARGSLPVPLPAKSHGKREALIELAIEMISASGTESA